MSDILCAVCGEPWEAYGLRDSMAPWQVKLFKLGAGCPCCEGDKPEPSTLGDNQLAFARSVIFDGDDNPESFAYQEVLADLETGAECSTVPAWEEPEPETVWECVGCGVRCVIGNETGEYEWYGGRPVHYQGSSLAHPFSDLYRADDFDPETEYHTLDGARYCPGCAECCAECDTVIFARQELEGDTYDAGSSFPHPLDEYHRGAVCYECCYGSDTEEHKFPRCYECNTAFESDNTELDSEGCCDDCGARCGECGEKDIPLDSDDMCGECSVWVSCVVCGALPDSTQVNEYESTHPENEWEGFQVNAFSAHSIPGADVLCSECAEKGNHTPRMFV